MPLFVFTHTLISFFLVLSGVVGVVCGAGADIGPLMRISPSSVAARSRKYLTGFSSCGFDTQVRRRPRDQSSPVTSPDWPSTALPM
jgi:hypothetical protein